MNYIIRNAEMLDLSQLVDLCEKHALFEKAEYHKTDKEKKLKYLIFSHKPVLYCLVVTVNEILVGYASYTFDYSTWDAQVFLYLDCLFLEHDFRNYGIGAAVFNKLKVIGQSNNCINIQWQTPVFNEGAIKFYNRIGSFPKEKLRFTLPLKY